MEIMEYSNKSYEELLREEERLTEEYSFISDECAQEGVSYKDFCERAKEVKQKLYFISKYMRLKQEPIIEYGKEWNGNTYTLETFQKLVKDKLLMDSDGYGSYATEDAKSNVYVYPSDITENIYRDDFTHIIWFNR
jgi:hypothetical protein